MRQTPQLKVTDLKKGFGKLAASAAIPALRFYTKPLNSLFPMNSIHQDLKHRDLEALNCQTAWPPSCYWNIFPGNRAYLLLQRFHHNLSFQEWGLVTEWFTQMKTYQQGKAIPYIRREKLDLVCWEGPLQHQRCLIPINGFFTTTSEKEGKRVLFSRKPDQSVFYAAGLCPFRQDKPGSYGFSIITTDPPLSSPIKGSKVPTLLHPTQVERWLSEEVKRDEALNLVQSNHRETLETFEVATQALSPRHQNRTVVMPIP